MSAIWPTFMPAPSFAYTYVQGSPVSSIRFDAGNTRHQRLTDESPTLHSFEFELSDTEYTLWRLWWRSEAKHGSEFVENMPFPQGAGTDTTATGIFLASYSANRTAFNSIKLAFDARPAARVTISFGDFDPTDSAPTKSIPLDDMHDNYIKDSEGNVIGEMLDGPAPALYPGIVVGSAGDFWPNCHGFPRWQHWMTSPRGSNYIEFNYEPRYWVMPHPDGMGMRIDDQYTQATNEFTTMMWVNWQYTHNEFDWYFDPLSGLRASFPTGPIFSRGFEDQSNISLYMVNNEPKVTMRLSVKADNGSGGYGVATIDRDVVAEAFVFEAGAANLNNWETDTFPSWSWVSAQNTTHPFTVTSDGSNPSAAAGYYTIRPKTKVDISTKTSGKYYIAYGFTSTGERAERPPAIGVLFGTATFDPDAAPGYYGFAYLHHGKGHWATGGNFTYGVTYGSSWTNGDEVGMLIDIDNDELRFYKNGVDQGVVPGTPADFANIEIRPIIGGRTDELDEVHTWTLRAESDDWVATEPSGAEEVPFDYGLLPESRLIISRRKWMHLGMRYIASTGSNDGKLQLIIDGVVDTEISHNLGAIYSHPTANHFCVGSLVKTWDSEFERPSTPIAMDSENTKIENHSSRIAASDLVISGSWLSDEDLATHATSQWDVGANGVSIGGVSYGDKLYPWQSDIWFYGENISVTEIPTAAAAWYDLGGTFRDINDNFASMFDWTNREGIRPRSLPVYSFKDGTLRVINLDGFEQAISTARSKDLKDPHSENPATVGAGNYSLMGLVGPQFDRNWAATMQIRIDEIPVSGRKWLWFGGRRGENPNTTQADFGLGIYVDSTGAVKLWGCDAIKTDQVYTWEVETTIIATAVVGTWYRIGLRSDYDTSSNAGEYRIGDGAWTSSTTFPGQNPAWVAENPYLYKRYDAYAAFEWGTSDGIGGFTSANFPRMFWGAGIEKLYDEAARVFDTYTLGDYAVDGTAKLATKLNGASGFIRGNMTTVGTLGKHKVCCAAIFAGTGTTSIGFVPTSHATTIDLGKATSGLGVYSDGSVWFNNVQVETNYATWSAGAEVALTIDYNTQEFSVHIDGVNQGVISAAVASTSETYYFGAGTNTLNDTIALIAEFSDFSEKAGAIPPMPLECYVMEVIDSLSIQSYQLQYTKLGIRRVFLMQDFNDVGIPDTTLDKALLVPELKFEIRPVGGAWTDYAKHIQWVWPNYIRCQVPGLAAGAYEVQITNENGDTSNIYPITILDVAATPGIRSTHKKWDFTQMTIQELDVEWQVLHRQWGGIHGRENAGVGRKLIGLDNTNGLICETHGDFYTGDHICADKMGNPWYVKERCGSAIASKQFFGPGTFRVVTNQTARVGAALAFWLFHYEEIYPEDERWTSDPDLAATVTQGNGFDGYYKVRNHEIDFPETPSSLKTDPTYQWAQHHKMKFNAWRGEQAGEFSDNFFDALLHFNDGNWHEIVCEWKTHTSPRETSVFVDGIKLLTIADDQYVPDICMKMTMGIWFPSVSTNLWAGPVAGFDRAQTFVREFEYTPWDPSEMVGYRVLAETYPYEGYAPFDTAGLPAIPFAPHNIRSLLAEFVATKKYNNPRRGTAEPAWDTNQASHIMDLAGGHNLNATLKTNPYTHNDTTLGGSKGSIRMTYEALSTIAPYAPWNPPITGYAEVFFLVKRSVAGASDLLGNASWADAPYASYAADGTLTVRAFGTDALSIVAPAALSTIGKWYIVRLVFNNAGNSQIYVNGVLCVEGALGVVNIARLTLPSGYYSWAHFLCYTKPVTAYELTQLYAWYVTNFGVIINGR